MHVSTSTILRLLGPAGADGDASLAVLARRAGRSVFEVHRAFRRVVGVTPKRYTARLRLERAASELVATSRSILDIALARGFASHEVFTRAFVRHFRMTPRAYRARGLLATGSRSARARAIAARHAAVVRSVGPCIGLHHMQLERTPMTAPVPVTRRTLSAQPTLVIRRKIALAQVAQELASILPRVFAFAQQHGVPFAGPPFTRYVELGLGTATIEAGFAVGAPASGEGDIVGSELPGGDAAVAIHVGAYERLPDTHAIVTAWIDAQKLAAGSPWEVYVTDPGEFPDPADWRTEIVYPLVGPARTS
jgi:AraC family transcriptional regulator